MADIHIVREHALGFAAARKIAVAWVEQGAQDFGLECTYTEGETKDEVGLARAGLDGMLQVTADRFELNVELGFLLGAFKDKIEAQIGESLDRVVGLHAGKGND